MISIIVPIKNEEGNITLLVEGIKENLKNEDWEIIFIDDGSTDSSVQEVTDLKKKDKRIVLLTHRKSFGKGRALTTGFEKANGEIIFFMDADLQDDPNDLHKFLEKIRQGYDLVNGWRSKRQDDFIKTIPSRIGNKLILRSVLNSKFHDINCGYKAMRREILENISLYGDNFRFLPIIAEKEGYKTTEVPVEHHPRKFGTSKYGFFRRFSIFIDIFSAYFIYKFREKPLHFFGLVGGILFLSGFLPGLYMIIERMFFGRLLYNRPAFLLAMVLIIVGIQILMTGIVAELMVYLKFSKSKKAEG
ncbi:MAG TPA: glycosyltransferase family 2 protein [Candidatus Nitrosocosmicus sp.]|nr:glycosyltransferase family 2 protein [Candidatus Nitrosocosmicus sp.]